MSVIKSYLLGLGGNLGQVEQSFILAIGLLVKRIGNLQAISSIYLSDALQIDYTTKQNDYLNCVAEFKSDKSVLEVFDVISKLEIELGRTRVDKWGPRVIDIDIIAVDDLVFSSEQLQVPHSEMQKRSFVLMPLAEIAPTWAHPILKKTVLELNSDLNQPRSCKILKPFPHCES